MYLLAALTSCQVKVASVEVIFHKSTESNDTFGMVEDPVRNNSNKRRFVYDEKQKKENQEMRISVVSINKVQVFIYNFHKSCIVNFRQKMF